jgi:hypothetical protein
MRKAVRIFIIFAASLTVMSGHLRAQEAADKDETKATKPNEERDEKPAKPLANDKNIDNLSVEQIGGAPTNSTASDYQIATQATGKNDKALVGQLPPDLEIPPDDDSQPEIAISRPIVSPEAALYGQVAEAWQVIRQRGQQPTPELIAREIGPDTLATFLDQNPAAADIFGRDSDTLPADIPGLEGVPDGGIEILPPGQAQ